MNELDYQSRAGPHNSTSQAATKLLALLQNQRATIDLDLTERNRLNHINKDIALKYAALWFGVFTCYGLSAYAIWHYLDSIGITSALIDGSLYLVGFVRYLIFTVYYTRSQFHRDQNNALDRAHSNIAVLEEKIYQGRSFVLLLRDFGTVANEPGEGGEFGPYPDMFDRLVKVLERYLRDAAMLLLLHNAYEATYNESKLMIPILVPSNKWQQFVPLLCHAAAVIIFVPRAYTPGVIEEAAFLRSSGELLSKLLLLHPNLEEGGDRNIVELVSRARWSVPLKLGSWNGKFTCEPSDLPELRELGLHQTH